MKESVLLIVDDDRDTLGQLAWFLRDAYEVLVAENPGEAREIIGRRSVDLILLDLHLPPNTSHPDSGLGFLKWAREAKADLPVIVMSSHPRPDTEARCRSAGAFRFFEKPVATGELRRALERALAVPFLRCPSSEPQ